jgi:succinate dehydrogenase / fumarate reductase cytochrome b subunit
MSAAEPPRPRARPVYLDLTRIRQPLPAIVSILHRISGAGLFLFGIPLLLYVTERSLASADAFAGIAAAFTHPLVKLVLIGFIWAYLHHFCAGIRFLLLDLNIGIRLKPARQSSVAVLVVSLVLTAIAAIRLW